VTADALFEMEAAPSGAAPSADAYSTWVAEVLPAFERAARSGEVFMFADVAKREQLPDPPNPRSHWGRLARRLADTGLIERAGFGQTPRPSGKDSAVRTWRGVPDRHLGAAA